MLSAFALLCAHPVGAQGAFPLPYVDSGADPGPIFSMTNTDNTTGIGLYGECFSAQGCGVQGKGVYGVWGIGNSTGVYAQGGPYGVYGQGSSYGVFGYSATGYGLYGFGSTYGVYGEGAPTGVYGHGNNYGVYGYGNNYGVYGSGGSYGVYSGGNAYVDGNLSCLTLTQRSDARLKRNIRPLSNSLGKLLALRGVTFEWKKQDKHTPAGPQIGFVAQEVEKVLPELVRKDHDGFRGVNYSAVVPILVEALKQEHRQMSALQADNLEALKQERGQMSALQSDNARLHAQVAALASDAGSRTAGRPFVIWTLAAVIACAAVFAGGKRKARS